MFYGCSSLVQLPDITKWNMKVIFIKDIFSDCDSLLSIPDISKLNLVVIGNVENIFGQKPESENSSLENIKSVESNTISSKHSDNSLKIHNDDNNLDKKNNNMSYIDNSIIFDNYDFNENELDNINNYYDNFYN